MFSDEFAGKDCCEGVEGEEGCVLLELFKTFTMISSIRDSVCHKELVEQKTILTKSSKICDLIDSY